MALLLSLLLSIDSTPKHGDVDRLRRRQHHAGRRLRRSTSKRICSPVGRAISSASINVGKSSETVSGTSEPDHHPPRPCIHDRFARDVAAFKPDLVVACYGMNDGNYFPSDEERFEKYKSGMTRFIERVFKETPARRVGALDAAALRRHARTRRRRTMERASATSARRRITTDVLAEVLRLAADAQVGPRDGRGRASRDSTCCGRRTHRNHTSPPTAFIPANVGHWFIGADVVARLDRQAVVAGTDARHSATAGERFLEQRRLEVDDAAGRGTGRAASSLRPLGRPSRNGTSKSVEIESVRATDWIQGPGEHPRNDRRRPPGRESSDRAYERFLRFRSVVDAEPRMPADSHCGISFMSDANESRRHGLRLRRTSRSAN